MVAKISFEQIDFVSSFFSQSGVRQIALTAGGITGTELNASVAGTGLAGGGGSALSIDTVSTVTFGQNAVWTFDNDTTGKGLFVTGPIVDANHVANKAYVDAMSEGLHLKPSVDAATIGILDDETSISVLTAYYNMLSTYGEIDAVLAVSGVFTVDGVTLVSGDRLLLKDEDKGNPYSAKVTTIADVAGSLNSTYFLFYTSWNLGYYVWYDVTGFGGVDPTPTRTGKTFTGIKVTVASGATAAAVATATKNAIDTAITLTNSIEKGGKPTLTIGGGGNNEITFVNAQGGMTPDTADGTATPNQPTLFTFGTLDGGTGLTASANGIWVVTITGTALRLTRAADFNDVTAGEVSGGAFTFVDAGTVNANAGFVVTTDSNDLTMGTATGEVNNWTQFSGAGAIVAGVGLNKAGNTLNLNIPGLTDMGAAIVAADTIAMYDTSAGPGVAAHREATFTQLLTFVISSLGDLTATANGGIGSFTYDGSAAVNIALDVNGMTDIGAAVVGTDELAIWDDGVGMKKTDVSRIAAFVAESYYTTVEVDIPSASFTFAGGVSYFDLATAAIIGATVDYGNILTRNGVDDMTNVGNGGTANTAVKWKLNNGGGGGVGRVTIGADVTALGNTYRVRYKKLT
jgi:hypothetical protein